MNFVSLDNRLFIFDLFHCYSTGALDFVNTEGSADIECPLSIRWPKSSFYASCHLGVQLWRMTAPIQAQCEGHEINWDKQESNKKVSIRKEKAY